MHLPSVLLNFIQFLLHQYSDIQLLLADALNISVSPPSFINLLSLSMPGLLVKVLSSIAPRTPLSAFLPADRFQTQQYILQSHWLTDLWQTHTPLSSSQYNVFLFYTSLLCWILCYFAVEIFFSCFLLFSSMKINQTAPTGLTTWLPKYCLYSVSIFLYIFNYLSFPLRIVSELWYCSGRTNLCMFHHFPLFLWKIILTASAICEI